MINCLMIFLLTMFPIQKVQVYSESSHVTIDEFMTHTHTHTLNDNMLNNTLIDNTSFANTRLLGGQTAIAGARFHRPVLAGVGLAAPADARAVAAAGRVGIPPGGHCPSPRPSNACSRHRNEMYSPVSA